MNDVALAIENEIQNSRIELPKVNVVDTEDWIRVKYPDVPKVDNPTVVRYQVPLPEGTHTAWSTGISYKGCSKKGNQLLFLVVYVEQFGEVSLMVDNEELLKYGPGGLALSVECGEPRGGYTTVRSIKMI